jgi:dipeptidase
MKLLARIATAVIVLAAGAQFVSACTSILVTKGASKTGATMISYSADSEYLYGELYFKPGAQHLPNETRDIVDWESGRFLGRIKEAPVTYGRIGNMNECQVAIGETTFGGRKELWGPAGSLDYGSLICIALERSRTAREAIRTMVDLVSEYGYASTGESFSIGDPNEAWILDLIGRGKGQKGAVWVAVKLPDGTLSAHANHSRISRFPLHDSSTCMYAPDVISFARSNGWFKGEDKDFSFTAAYAPGNFEFLRFCEARVWSVFRRASPSLGLSSAIALGKAGAEPLPLWVKPDHKLGVHEVMELMRDHYEGTELDPTQDVAAGPHHNPYRPRPLVWRVDGKAYINERTISSPTTGWSSVSESRADLPNPIGGVLWFGVGDTYSTVYIPIYCANQAIPHSFAEGTGSMHEFTWDSAFWTFSFVGNYAYSRYDDMIRDIQRVQRELEGGFLTQQEGVEAQAVALYRHSPLEAREFLTNYSCRQGEMVTNRWKKLGEFLIWKYLDGFVRDSRGRVGSHSYSEDWLRRIVQDKGDAILVPDEVKATGLAPGNP